MQHAGGDQTVSVLGGQKGFCSIPFLFYPWCPSVDGAPGDIQQMRTHKRQRQPWGCGLQDVFNENFSHLAQPGPFQLVNKWVLRWFNESAQENFTNVQRWLWLRGRDLPQLHGGEWAAGYEQLLKAIWNTLAIEVSSGKQTALDWIPS